LSSDETLFSLGTFVSATSTAFPALVIRDNVFAISDLGLRPSGIRLPTARLSMLDVVELWDDILPVLSRAAERLGNVNGVPRESLQTLAPLLPRQIVCAGANYRKHVIDLLMDHPASGSDPSASLEERRRHAERVMDHRATVGQPFAFVKGASAVLDPFADLMLPPDSSETDWELELGVVIGKHTRRVRRERAMDHVAGYVVCNDISARDHLARPDFPTFGLDFLAGKSSPGFLPLGPVIVPAKFIPNPQDLMITLRLNGETMQSESTSNMIFPIPQLIEYVSTHIQLLPGDVICTGSPSGNGAHYRRFLRPGDSLEGTIEKLGTQRNRCVAEVLPDGAVVHRPFVALGSP
jgi:2-keto-4-pentenoate hydratase/2-oxohepta-3-ene-1,7-dioic acid hydratase in catechol pathway